MINIRLRAKRALTAEPRATRQPESRLRYVDGFRGLAALYVVLHHAWFQSWPKSIYGDVPTGWTATLTGWLEYGHFGVTFFICISGFCLMQRVLQNEGTLGSGGARRFFLSRARRILPPYYIALALSIALAISMPGRTHSLYDKSLPMTTAGVISHLALVHNLHESTASQISGPLWTIAVECQIYLLFPLLVAARRKFGMQAVMFGTFFVSIVLLGPVAETRYRGLSPHLLFEFAMGMYAAELSIGPRRRSVIWLAWTTVALIVCMFQSPGLRTALITDLMVGLVAATLLIDCAQRPRSVIARVMSSPSVAGLGVFSYSMYLLHFPIQQVLWLRVVLPARLERVVTFGIMATFGTGLIVAVSFVFYWWFERPFCNHLDRPMSAFVLSRPGDGLT
jgi:peptidoglycan/LPS O-acetylase OafA/YrhL